MSYALSLDEYDEERLRSEIDLREGRRRRGLCDYCGRKPTTSDCRFPDRHHHEDIVIEDRGYVRPLPKGKR